MAVTATPDAPPWTEEVEECLNSLQKLAPGWDSRGGRPVSGEIASAAFDLLIRVARADTPRPSIVPTARGGVQFEWHLGGLDLEVEAVSANEVQVLFESPAGIEEWSFDPGADPAPLAGAVSQLSPSK